MMEVSTLRSSHLDQVNDIVFDFYGRRMVTCSSDRTMKVWDYNTKSNEWTFLEVKGHSDCVWRAAWASPEFGQIIASCSEDCSAKIWEEQESMESNTINWVCRSTMKPCRKPVKDVKFVHKELGLKVALACADGFIYFLEAKNIFDLATWEPLMKYHVEDITTQIAVNTAIARRSSEHGLTSLAFSTSSFEDPRVAVGGYGQRVIVYKIRDGDLQEELSLEGSQGRPVSDIAWAPTLGRSYHLVAVASRDATFKIFRIDRNEEMGSSVYRLGATDNLTNPSGSEVWRLSWNSTGTALTVASTSGAVSIWRRNFSGKWEMIQEIVKDDKAAYFQFGSSA